MKYDKKYNTPGLRRGKVVKEDFGSFKKAMNRQRINPDKESKRLARDPEPEDPVWAKRAFIALGIPVAILAVGGVAWLLLLNVGNFSTFTTRDGDRNLPSQVDVAKLSPLERNIYLGRQANGRTEYKLAWQYFRPALAEAPGDQQANIGMLIALEGLVMKDDGWRPLLKEHEQRMEEMAREE